MSSAATATVTESAALADRLYVAHAASLLAYCRRRLGSSSDAEDAVQTTFLYATRALQRGVVPESESAWLHAIATNVCRWQRRTAARRECVASDPIEGPVASEPAPEARSDLALVVREALARVPERQRRALVLRELHGLPASEVATELGLAPSQTYALLARARRSFARAYDVVTGRTSLGVQVGPLLLKLKSVLSGGTATVVAATSIGGGVILAVAGASERDGAPTRAAPGPADVRGSDRDLPRADARDVAVVPALGTTSARAVPRVEPRGRTRASSGAVLPEDEAPAAAPPSAKDRAGPADQAVPTPAGPSRSDDPASPPDPTLALAGELLPLEEPELGLDLPGPAPLPDAGELLDPVTPEPLPGAGEVVDPLPVEELPPAAGVPLPKVP